jgi:hypothetical protein
MKKELLNSTSATFRTVHKINTAISPTDDSFQILAMFILDAPDSNFYPKWRLRLTLDIILNKRAALSTKQFRYFHNSKATDLPFLPLLAPQQFQTI